MGELNIYSRASARDYYNAGCQFRDAALRCYSDAEGNIMKDNRLIQLPVPTVVNGAFACEMYLKALLVLENVPFPRIHDLDKLFDKLSSEKKDIVSKFVMPKNTIDYQLKFHSLLVKYRNVFKSDRYYAERQGWQSMSPTDIIIIVHNLSEITGAYIE